MRTVLLFLPLWAAAGLLHADRPAAQDEDLMTIGKRVFTNRCSRCHFVPDLSIRRDQIWVNLISTTA